MALPLPHKDDPQFVTRFTDHVLELTKEVQFARGEISELSGRMMSLEGAMIRLDKAVRRELRVVEREVTEVKEDSKIIQIRELQKKLNESESDKRWRVRKTITVVIGIALVVIGALATETWNVITKGNGETHEHRSAE